MTLDRKDVEDAFEEYVSKFDNDDTKIKIKIYHTYQVAEISDLIAASLDLDEDDIELAWIIGMLHDIGRFEQLKRFNTLLDNKSIDHAEFGADLLFEEGLINSFIKYSDCSKEEFNIIEVAIRNHNKLEISDGLSEREKMFCNIIRDADKLDIFRICSSERLEDVYDMTKQEIENSDISPEVLVDFYEHHAVNRINKKTAADHVLGLMSLGYELVYRESLVMCQRQGYYSKLMNAVKWAKEETNIEMINAKKEMIKFFHS